MKKQLYESPQVEQMSCRVERGFAGSGSAERLTDGGSIDGAFGSGSTGGSAEGLTQGGTIDGALFT